MSIRQPGPHTVVVGAGPAGMMAAEVLAGSGCAVTLVDHMRSVGRKFLLAGRSGLNLTNAEPIDAFLDRYGNARRVLEPAIREFGSDALRAWAASLGEDTYIGTSGRVFPDSLRATPLLRAWIRRLRDLDVQILTGHRFVGWETHSDGRTDPLRVRLLAASGQVVVQAADAVVLALGGASWPRVGSDGQWVPLLRAAGIDVAELLPANAGLERQWSTHFVERFEGVPLKNISVSHGDHAVRGDAMVTRRGLEGLPIYSHTASVRDELATAGTATIVIDLHPDLTVDQVRERLARRRPRDSWSNGVRRALGLAPVAIALLREATGNQPPTSTTELAALVKALPLRIDATAGIQRAISSAGGIRLSEIDEHFMLRSLLGVFVAGEMLDWEAPTGGFLLQATFATAVAAARGAFQWATMSR